MKFSVIIPTYNEQDYIESCLKSVIEQNFDSSEFEIIVSDSSSSDKTVEIARSHHARVVSSERRGIAHGRNAGAKAAEGDILLFVDADVKLGRDFLRHVAGSFSAHVVGVSGLALPSDGKWFPRFVYRGTSVLVRSFNRLGLPLYPGLCVAYRREAFEKAGGFREDFGVGEDIDLSRRISRFGKCVVNPAAVAYVSTRRLEKHAVSTVVFHIYNDVRYLMTGRSARHYPKSEELRSWSDLWRLNRK
jgi:cellulose synthase/poly-beta-1,6-N-acetylglucosamine synthase-like glycosyltransferase